MKFTAGQKVVCINDDYRPVDRRWMQTAPKRGEVYTVREIETRGCKGVGIRLAEIINLPIPVERVATGEVYQMEPPFHENRFVVAPDISALRALLTTRKPELELSRETPDERRASRSAR